MRLWNQHYGLRARVAFALWSLTAAHAHAATLALSDVPLFTTQSAPANLIMAIDDSGSMDFEVLLPTNIGTLWWDDDAQSFYQKTNQNQYLDASLGQSDKFSLGYLFPGEDTKFGDTLVYSIPPTKQFAFLRSHEFNPLYFNPNETYSPWPASIRDDGTARNFPSQLISTAKLDPRCDSGCTELNLTIERLENASKARFFIPNKFTLPKGTRYAKNGVWITAPEDLSYEHIGRRDLGIGYIPGVFYTKVDDGSATFTLDSDADAIPIACIDSTPAHYDTFYNAPSEFSSPDGVDALAPDGSCLAEHRLRTGTPQAP